MSIMNKSKGFTLVELIVVVALVSMLIVFWVLFVPRRSHSGELAKRAQCAADLKGIDTAAYTYSRSNGEKYPIGWRHEKGNWDVADKSSVTPEDSFALLVHLDYLPTKILICPSVGGVEAEDEWELVALDGKYKGDPGAAAEAYIHYAYQDVGVGDGKNYLRDSRKDNPPVFADRGQRTDPANSNYRLTGKAGANHPTAPGSQNVLGVAHGVVVVYSKTDECMAGYIDGELGDNIYTDSLGENDTYLLSSKAQTGSP